MIVEQCSHREQSAGRAKKKKVQASELGEVSSPFLSQKARIS